MAGTAIECRRENATGSEVWNLRKELNKVITDLETLRAAIDAIADKLDSDGGVSDTDYATTADVAASSALTAATVNNSKQ
jgi:hypothetical protein